MKYFATILFLFIFIAKGICATVPLLYSYKNTVMVQAQATEDPEKTGEGGEEHLSSMVPEYYPDHEGYDTVAWQGSVNTGKCIPRNQFFTSSSYRSIPTPPPDVV